MMKVIRKLSRAEYFHLREEVRKNTFINSRQCFLKRFEFEDKNVSVLMGGIVCKRKELVLVDRRNDSGVHLSVVVEVEEYDWRYPVIGSGISFLIYDFSGMFRVYDVVREGISAWLDVKEGEIIYVIGKVNPLNDRDGYLIHPRWIGYTEDLEVYRMIYKDDLEKMKRQIDSIKEKPSQLDISRILYYNANWRPIEVVRHFLRRDERIEPDLYYWLSVAGYEYYLKKPSPQIAMLVWKYYRKYMESQDFSDVDKLFCEDRAMLVRENFRKQFPMAYRDVSDFSEWR